MTGLRITDVRFTSAHADDRGRGLLGFVTCLLCGQIRLDGIALRRGQDGRVSLAYPERRDSAGRGHPYIRPVDDAARRAIEVAVFKALSLDGAQATQDGPDAQDREVAP